MKVTLEELPKQTLQDFAVKHDLVMKVTEREPMFWGVGRYYARFQNCEIKDGSFLSGTCGNGETPAEAIENYSEKIRCKLLVIGAYSPERREINAPFFV